MDCYRVAPGSKVNLAKILTKDSQLFPKLTKETHVQALDGLREELKEQQHLLFAANGPKILVVVQAMDTGGKDGAIRNVAAALNPRSCPVTPFKKPPEEELAHVKTAPRSPSYRRECGEHCPGRAPNEAVAFLRGDARRVRPGLLEWGLAILQSCAADGH